LTILRKLREELMSELRKVGEFTLDVGKITGILIEQLLTLKAFGLMIIFSGQITK